MESPLNNNHLHSGPHAPHILNEAVSNELMENWLTLVSKRWMVLISTAVIAVGLTLYYAQLPDLYEAETKILVEHVEQVPKTEQDMVVSTAPANTEEDYYGTQIAIISGRKMAETVEQELGEPVQYSINVKRIRDTRIIALSCKSADPETAARVANKFAEVFVRESSREGLYVTQQILQWIPDDIETLENKEAMDRISSGLTGVNKKAFAESFSTIAQDTEIQKLRSDKMSIQTQLHDLSQRYRPEYPEMVELSQRLNYVENQLKQHIKTKLDLMKANLAGKLNITNIRVLEEAVTPSAPAEPDRARGVLLGTVLGFLGVIGFVLFIEGANQKVRTEHDLETACNLPFLGYLPLVKVLLQNKKNVTQHGAEPISVIEAIRQDGLLADSVASIRTHILFSVPYEKSKRIMLTSAIPDEGKSTVAALLAYSLTGLGRHILLIDADMRKPFLHTSLGVPNEKGLTDYLVGNVTIDEVIRTVEGTDLKVITAGRRTPNPSELLASERLRELLDRATEMFDRVVIDVPPVLFIPDALVLAKHVHTGVLVCGSGMVDKKTVRTVKEKFDSIGHSFIGAIVNRADYEHEGYRYKYLKTYTKYYKKKRPVVA